MDHNKEIEKLVLELGGSFVGFSKVKDKLPESLVKYPYAVTQGVKLSSAILDEVVDKPTFNYFNHYRSVNALIDQINLRVLLYIERNGYNAYTIAASQSIPDAKVPYSGIFPHKTGAVMAGLGWIGKSGLFISKDFGPSVRLGTILTDMPLESKTEVMANQCGSCRKCVDSCPAMALSGVVDENYNREKIVDAKACSEHMKKKYQNIGRGSVCGICVSICPYRKRA